MSGRSVGGLAALTLVALTAALSAACATTGADSGTAAPEDLTTSEAAPIVPDLIGQDAAAVDKLAAAAGVVPVISYEPGAAGRPGTVVRVDPPPGTAVTLGATIEVAVAGPHGATLDDLVAADRRVFVGLAADPDGTLVVAVTSGPDAEAALRRIEPALTGRRHRIVRCDATWVELARLSAEIGQRADLRTTGGYTIAIDPGACAVRVEGAIAADVVAALRRTYAARIVVEPGGPAGRADGAG